MFNKLYEYIKENFKFLTILLIIFLSFTIELPYYIDIPGGLMNVDDKISIKNAYSSEGTFNLAYVSELKATIPTILYSLINKDWDICKKEVEETNDYRSHLMLKEANSNAIIVGFSMANEYYSITKRQSFVTYIEENADTDLQISDEIIEINGKKIKSKKEIEEIILNTSDTIYFKVINNNTIYNRFANKNNNKIGIILTEIKDVQTNRDVKFNFEKNESGPSGGFMMALSIYNYLTSEDLTKGLKIVGTGTIDESGNVGTIGGVNYKVKAASKENADIFFVPTENYDLAYKTKIENNLDIEIVKVSNINDAISYLKNIVNDN